MKLPYECKKTSWRHPTPAVTGKNSNELYCKLVTKVGEKPVYKLAKIWK